SAVSPNVQPSLYVPDSSRWFRTPPGARESSVLPPQPKSAAKGIVVISCASVRRQRLQLTDVASSEHRVFWFKRRDESGDDVGNITPTFLLAAAVQSGFADIVLVSALLVGQVTELHRLHDAIDDHGRSEPRSQTQKEHLAALVAPQSLHRGVVDDLHGMAECRCEIEPDPATA